MSFSSIFQETMTKSHGMYNTLAFLQAVLESSNKKNMHTLHSAHKTTCEFKATELRAVVPTFPPLSIICIQGF